MIWGAVTDLVGNVVGGFKDHFEHKRKIKEAKTQAKIQRLNSKQDHKQKWEIKQLENTGWKDDVLFYFFIGLFIYTGFCPEMAEEFFENLSILPGWFIKTWMSIVASVLGLKKFTDYGPKAVEAFKDTLKKTEDGSTDGNEK